MAVRTWIVSYDVSSHRARTRLSRVLEARGPRILYSVFEIVADDRDLEHLIARARALLEPHDRLLLFPSCGNCRCWSTGADLEPGGHTVVSSRP